MNKKKLFTTLALSAMLLTGCSFKNEAIIEVNGESITMSQYEDAFNQAIGNSMFAQMGIDVKKDKNSFLYLMIKDRVVSELVVKELINQEVEKRHIKVTKDDVNNEIKNIIDKIGSKEKFNEVLKQNNVSTSQLKKDLTEELKVKKLVNSISKVSVSENDCKNFYKKNLNKFKYPDKVRALHILVSANPEEIKEKIASDPANKKMSKEEIKALVDKEVAADRVKAEKLLAQVKKNPADFEKIARDNSDDKASAKKGGDLGFFTKQEMVQPFSKVAFSQKPNTISDIVQTPYGFHIILVKDRMQAGQEPFEKVKGEIMIYLENQEQVKVLDKFIESLKKQAKIDYVNKEFNPTSIQDALKKQSQNDPAAKEALNPEAQSATPAPEKAPEKK